MRPSALRVLASVRPVFDRAKAMQDLLLLIKKSSPWDTDPEGTRDLYFESIEAEADVAVRVVSEAAKRAAVTHPIIVRARVNKGYERLYDATIDVYVGRASFTLMGDKDVEDLMEDPRDFSSPEEMGDYLRLAQEIKRPGSTQRGKRLTLYTARPKKDRAYFEKSKTVPVGMFLSSSDAESQSRAFEQDRDLYQVVVPEAALVETNNRGGVRWYQVTKETPAVITRI